MTNIKEYNQYLIDCIDLSGFDLDHLETDADKINAVHNIFMSEYGWNIAQSGNKTKSIASWLSGLPSSITIAFYNCDILDLAVKFGSLKENSSEYMQDKIISQYFMFMAIRLNSLFNKHAKP